jgi:hypothetical protein
VSGDAAYADDLSKLRGAARQWRDTSRLPKTFVDEEAPVIDQPNVPANNDGHRERTSAWFRERVEATKFLLPE